MGNIEDIKNILKEGNVIIGAEETIKSLRAGKINKIYLTLNCSEIIKEEIKNFSSINNVKIVQLKIPGSELGAICKKPFSISVLGVAK